MPCFLSEGAGSSSPATLFFALVTVAGLTACDDGASRTSYSVVDSVGVRIVESHEPAWAAGEGWSVSAEPLLEVGVREGAEASQLFRVTDALRLPDGRIAVLNGGSSTVRVFGGDGDFLTEFGGPGDGPGEFRSLSSGHHVAGDTLLLWDGGRRAISLFTTDGGFIRTRTLTVPGSGMPSEVRLLPGPHVLVKMYASPLTQAGDFGTGIHRLPVPFLRYDLAGILLDTLGVFPGQETMVGVSLLGPPPFYKETWVDVAEAHVYVGPAEEMDVSVYDVSGDLQALFRYPGVDLALDEGDREWFGNRVRENAPPARRDRVGEVLAGVIFPETRAAYSDLKVDPTGAVWLRTGRFHPVGAPPTRWSVFSSEGVFLGDVTLPEGFRPFEFGVDHVLGVWKDEMGVEFVRIYGIEKREGE
jgi:hypothetical protein